MTEMDLIPADYRSTLKIKIQLRVFVFTLVLLFACGGVTYFSIVYVVNIKKQELSILQQEKSVSTQQRSRLDKIRTQKSYFDSQLKILDGLRSGVRVDDIFVVIDRAFLRDNIWFTNWKFIRAGALVEKTPDTVNTGYFIVVPKDEQNNKQKAWKIDTHMEITGQAKDYSALSNFVQRLLEQPEIRDVKVIKTVLRNYSKYRVVNYDLAIVVNGSIATND